MKVVKFTRHYAQYTPGDVAGFEDARADRLVDAEIAETFVPDSKEGKASQKADTGKPAAKG
ncbi:hypothetical protein [Burkholderia cenocepacia]|uniref:hypothetical protein n=1 Tax=Burkholderia cenocepacia TaxID=95486 RepID=UPI001B95FD40|nr:hypothetical protein [Burkholderia cenocepacia]MBR8135142.1 hypothetical protein [Burkholderia cenocepacia]